MFQNSESSLEMIFGLPIAAEICVKASQIRKRDSQVGMRGSQLNLCEFQCSFVCFLSLWILPCAVIGTGQIVQDVVRSEIARFGCNRRYLHSTFEKSFGPAQLALVKINHAATVQDCRIELLV